MSRIDELKANAQVDSADSYESVESDFISNRRINLNDLLKLKELINTINNSSECKNPLVISGAGPTGVELACKVSDLVDDRVEIYLIEKLTAVASRYHDLNFMRHPKLFFIFMLLRLLDI